MDFLILRPLSPETAYHFFWAGVGGGQRFVLRSLCSVGFEGGSDWAETTSRPVPPAAGRPEFKLPTYASAVGCITVGQLLDLAASVVATA